MVGFVLLLRLPRGHLSARAFLHSSARRLTYASRLDIGARGETTYACQRSFLFAMTDVPHRGRLWVCYDLRADVTRFWHTLTGERQSLPGRWRESYDDGGIAFANSGDKSLWLKEIMTVSSHEKDSELLLFDSSTSKVSKACDVQVEFAHLYGTLPVIADVGGEPVLQKMPSYLLQAPIAGAQVFWPLRFYMPYWFGQRLEERSAQFVGHRLLHKYLPRWQAHIWRLWAIPAAHCQLNHHEKRCRVSVDGDAAGFSTELGEVASDCTLSGSDDDDHCEGEHANPGEPSQAKHSAPNPLAPRTALPRFLPETAVSVAAFLGVVLWFTIERQSPQTAQHAPRSVALLHAVCAQLFVDNGSCALCLRDGYTVQFDRTIEATDCHATLCFGETSSVAPHGSELRVCRRYLSQLRTLVCESGSRFPDLLLEAARRRLHWLVPQMLRAIEHYIAACVDPSAYSSDAFDAPNLPRKSRPESNLVHQVAMREDYTETGDTSRLCKIGKRMKKFNMQFNAVLGGAGQHASTLAFLRK